jgi:phosphatidylserine/phosphatidylglycerophosphate/cardiolipin synthase-like enzyme
VKLYLRYPLHAKLYLLFRHDLLNPRIGYLGSSNLTLSGLSKQGELNVDVMDHDASAKLARWFEDRWSDRFCDDISAELVEIINNSWLLSRFRPTILTSVEVSLSVTSWGSARPSWQLPLHASLRTTTTLRR